MDRNQVTYDFMMKMKKNELLEWIIDFCMEVAVRNFLIDELLTDEYITKKEEALNEIANSLHEHFKKCQRDTLRYFIFKKHRLMCLTVDYLKEKCIMKKDVELFPM